MQGLIEQYLGNPVMLLALLFIGPFVLEEAAILAGAALVAAGELTGAAVFLALLAGIVVSDWVLYAIGALAGGSRRIRGWIAPDQLERGHRLLHRGVFPAGLLARLIPWMLFPVFVASGFFGVSFARFVLVNLCIALVYLAVFFAGALGLNVVLMELFGAWTWLIMIGVLLALIHGGRWVTRRYFPAEDVSPD